MVLGITGPPFITYQKNSRGDTVPLMIMLVKTVDNVQYMVNAAATKEIGLCIIKNIIWSLELLENIK